MLLLAASALSAQEVDWYRFERMLGHGEYKNVSAQAKKLFDQSTDGSQRLAAAYFIARAEDHYQEDAYDSAVARYRSLLPELDSLHSALCYAFLGSYDTALFHTPVLRRTPVSAISHYCDGSDEMNMTPTVYDVIVTMMQSRGGLTWKEKTSWQRKLCAFHVGDDDDIRIWHDMRLINSLFEWGRNKSKADTLQAYINKYRGTKSQEITMLYSMMAEELVENHQDYVRAMSYCDTAIQLAPKSRGGVACANARAEIQKMYVWVESVKAAYPGRQSLVEVKYCNTDHLWFRLIPYLNDFDYGDSERKMRDAKPLKQWNLQVPTNDKYCQETSLVALPALETGHYILLVSPTADFKKAGFVAKEVSCTDMQLVQCGQEGLLLDSKTGRPIVGQEVKIMKLRYNSSKTDSTLVATTRTDKDGRYRFDEEGKWNTKIVIDRNGYRLNVDYYKYSYNNVDTTWRQRVEVRMDRPIYKPGDTAHTAVVYFISDGREAMSAQFFQVRYVLRDPNGQEVLTDSVKTDSYGMASFQFVLPKDRLAGTYNLLIYNYNQHKTTALLRVEEYKQPKFMVTLSSDNGVKSPEFGKPYTVKGMAASYSAVPVSGAKVKYTIERRQLSHWWWRYGTLAGVNTVDNGELTTAADGSFEITFTPNPDSNENLQMWPCFEFTVRVDVTDLNGESHPASTTVRVGFRNAFIALDGGEEVRTLDGLKPRLFDLNGNSLPGKVDMKIELLRQPDVPLLTPITVVVGENIHQTMSEAEYRKAFPLFAYSMDYNNRSKWETCGQWNGESGVYRITLTAEGADTVVVYRTVTTADARKVQSQDLLWHDIDKSTAEVGDTVTLRFGSRFKDVEVHYRLMVGDNEREFRRIRVSDQLKSISIPVDSAMLGGFCINLIAVREGFKTNIREDVEVPFSHKKLNVEIATFRDRLQPGETEEWTIKVSDGEVVPDSARSHALYPQSSLILTMYDASLNSYGGSNLWTFSPWRSNWTQTMSLHEHNSRGIWHLKDAQRVYYKGNYPSWWTLRNALPRGYYRGYGTARGESGMVTLQGNVRKRTGVNDNGFVNIGAPESGSRISSEDIARMPGTSVESIVAAVGGVGYSDGLDDIVIQTAEEVEEMVQMDTEVETQVRMNLNTLAFFVAGLRTDSTGTATYSFTVPELLTRWNVRGLAVTRDIKIGTLDKTLVTSKNLMVQPNMPRFLRQGDSTVLMAKVVNLTDDERRVRVTYSLDNAADSASILTGEMVITVPANGSSQVTIPVSNLPRDLFVATFTIIAQTIDNDFERRDLPRLSDGERSQLPVLPNRQAVTISQAMYINGVGEKQYSMPELLAGGATREPRLVAAEVVSNPIWLAIKCMPYLKTHDNPSTLYLANQLYVNNMGNRILSALGVRSSELFDSSDKSPLSFNEDVKQTLMQATPWVRDAESEEEQMKAVANFFNPDELGRNIEKATKELQQRQNADGGWSWMPDSKSSVWVTQQVLKMIDSTRFNVASALRYIDNEHQRDYEKYIKPNLLKKWIGSSTNIDYLYTRSFYGKAKTEAYRYFYGNALKSYTEYENLSTQAQLALIFHRNGDRKQALDLLRRLKQKALENDEMGMYWRDNRSGWFWYQRPIETQALIIQAFAEITPTDTVSIGLMQQWLLKQKQTTHWGNDQATTKAIAALMVSLNSQSNLQTGEGQGAKLTVFGQPLTGDASANTGLKAPSSKLTQRWTGAALDTLLASRNDKIVLRKKDRGMAWATVYYQFTDELEKIPSSEMGITLKRSYLNLNNQGVQCDRNILKVGDRLKVRIEISCDRAMDYLELIDGRPSCVEPIGTRAGWRWCDGLSYYITVNNTDTRCYIEHIDKGKYVFEYEVYVTNPGTFVSGPVTMQCMYAPEFRAIAPATRLTVEQ